MLFLTECRILKVDFGDPLTGHFHVSGAMSRHCHKELAIGAFQLWTNTVSREASRLLSLWQAIGETTSWPHDWPTTRCTIL